MTRFNISLANLNIEMNCKYNFTREFCKDYITDSTKADIVATATDAEIIEEITASNRVLANDYVESICLYRSIAEQLPAFDCCVFHGAAISYSGLAYLFVAPSGTGKTTHIKLWRKYLGDRVDIINGDKPILHITDNGVTVYGTPYAGKEGWQKNTSFKLGGICIIKRGTSNRIDKLNAYKNLPYLIRQIYMPKSEINARRTLELTDKLCLNLPLYLLQCDISQQAVKTAFEALTGEFYNID